MRREISPSRSLFSLLDLSSDFSLSHTTSRRRFSNPIRASSLSERSRRENLSEEEEQAQTDSVSQSLPHQGISTRAGLHHECDGRERSPRGYPSRSLSPFLSLSLSLSSSYSLHVRCLLQFFHFLCIRVSQRCDLI